MTGISRALQYLQYTIYSYCDMTLYNVLIWDIIITSVFDFF